MSETFVGIDVGGTNVKIGLFDSELKLICKTSVATKADMGPDVVINKMAQTVEELRGRPFSTGYCCNRHRNSRAGQVQRGHHHQVHEHAEIQKRSNLQNAQ